MLRYLMFVIVAALIFSAGYTKANAQRKNRIEIKDVQVGEAKDNRIALDVSWGYIEQSRPRPSKIMVIAVFVGANGKEYKAIVNVPVNAIGPLPTNGKVVINHEEQIFSPRDFKFVVTVTPQIKDSASNNLFVGDKKELRLRVNPTK
jgi:hypothetical protein